MKTVKELFYRTEHDKNRPLISAENTKNEILKLLNERKEYYEKCSNVTISTDNYDTVKISKVIINKSNMNYALFQDSEISEFIVMLCDFSSSNFRRVKLTNFNFS